NLLERSYSTMKRGIFLLLLVTLIVGLAACGDNAEEDGMNNQTNANQENTESDNQDDEDQTIDVDLENDDGESVGTVTLEEESEGVEVTLEGENLPKGMHAFHIHENGQCEAPDFDSAGDHFNPDDDNHGFDDSDGSHLRVIPNIVVSDYGKLTQSFIVKDATLDEDSDYSLLADGGTSLIIHDGADDGESQPFGDAGDMIVCGPIVDDEE